MTKDFCFYIFISVFVANLKFSQTQFVIIKLFYLPKKNKTINDELLMFAVFNEKKLCLQIIRSVKLEHHFTDLTTFIQLFMYGESVRRERMPSLIQRFTAKTKIVRI